VQDNNDVVLKRELDGLLHYLNLVRSEIAAIGHPADEEHGFNRIGDRLNAIVNATADATNTIMESVEKNDIIADKLRETIKDPVVLNALDEIGKNSSDVYEACSFQDITSQHISQVLKSITYVEERVNSLIDFWGHDKLISTKVAAEERTEDKKLLNGPQLEGQGLSQDDIDLQFD
jgi:chemotaxis protein CheZ